MNEILEMLASQYLWDIAQFSKPWMYWCVLPICAFIPFFCVKWALLTLPVWWPILVIAGGVTVKAKITKQ